MRSLQSLLYGLSAIAPLVAGQIGGHCDPDVSQPNPIAKQYTTQITGTVNSTMLVVPIDLTLARSIIPASYRILKKQYQAWIPKLATDQYPAILQMELHHDLYNKGKAEPSGHDFLRASISFPFVDRLGDGYTAFTYSHQVLISESNTNLQASLAADYGYNISSAYFSTCNAYEYENITANLALPPHQRGIDQAGWAVYNTDLSNPDIAFRALPSSTSPYNDNFWYNVTNQPLFGKAGGTCDHVVRLFNTALSEAPYGPVWVLGNATALKPFFTPKSKTIWLDVYGLKIDVPYHETPNVACSTLQGTHVISAPS